VHLENRRALIANVLDRRSPDAHRVLNVLPVRENARDAVVFPLVEHLLVRRDVLRERVDRATVVDDEE
jgi:hypothetical protein